MSRLPDFLDAYDARTGVPLLHRPMALGAGTGTGSDPVLTWGGVSIARNTVYAAVGVTGSGQARAPRWRAWKCCRRAATASTAACTAT